MFNYKKLIFVMKKKFNNYEHSYVRECQIKWLLYNIESLQTYLINYGNQILFENEKKFNFLKCF
jgi:hypothetical protein